MCQLLRAGCCVAQVKALRFCFFETSREGAVAIFICFMVTSQMHCICCAFKDMGLPSDDLPPASDNRHVCTSLL